MQVHGIDHVNILTDDLEDTASFYEAVLGLRRVPNPALRPPARGYWLLDGADRPIVHLVDRLSTGDRYAAHRPGAVTNAVHHLALRCTGFEAARRRLDERGLAYRANDLPHIGVRQLFFADPNAVNIELNFDGD